MSEYIAVSEQMQKRWNKELTENGSLYLYAMTGYGKTVQAEVFVKEYFKEYARISAALPAYLIALKVTKQLVAENRTAAVKIA